MTDALLLAAVVSVGVVVYSLLRLPSLLFASMNRGTLWHLRDDLFDARRRDELPDAPDVEALLTRIETMILVLPRLSAARIWWLDRTMSRESRDRRLPPLLLCEGSPAQQRLFRSLQDELQRIVLRQYLIGSWSGLLLAAPRHRTALRHVLTRHGNLKSWGQAAGPTPVDWSEPERRRFEEMVEQATTVAETRNREGDLIAAGP